MSQNTQANGTSTRDDSSHVAAVVAETISSSSNAADDETEEAKVSDSTLAILFKQIEGADGVLDDVEDKLDRLLGKFRYVIGFTSGQRLGGQRSGWPDRRRNWTKLLKIKPGSFQLLHTLSTGRKFFAVSSRQ